MLLTTKKRYALIKPLARETHHGIKRTFLLTSSKKPPKLPSTSASHPQAKPKGKAKKSAEERRPSTN